MIAGKIITTVNVSIEWDEPTSSPRLQAERFLIENSIRAMLTTAAQNAIKDEMRELEMKANAEFN